MEVFDAVRTVLAVRAYQNKPVPADVIQRIVEAGHLTGSAMNAQPWHFIVVQNQTTISKIAEAARSGSYTAQAPVAIVVLIEKTRFALSDGSRAIQSMILTAWAEGVGSNWVGFQGMTGLHELLNIPDTLEVLAVLPLGYPTKEIGQGKKKRKPLGQVASREQYGQAFE